MLKKVLNLFDVARWLLDADSDSFLIYQPGKVGSTAVENALQNAGKKTLHAHQLHSDRVDFLPTGALSKTKRLRRKVYVAVTSWAFDRSRASVIVIVRNPVDHIQSLMFHHLDKVLYLYFQQNKDTRKHLSFVDILAASYRDIVNVDYASDWLEQDFLPLTGLDRSALEGRALPFEVANGGRRYLFLCFEELATSEEALADFTGLEEFVLDMANDSAQKWYASLYQEAKMHGPLADDLRRRLAQGALAKTFYGEPHGVSSA